MRRRMGLAMILVPALAGAGPDAAVAQSSARPGEPVEEVYDSADVRDRARARQAAFERRRARLLPRTLDGWSSRCDEIVGRFCEWYDEGEWMPDPEDPAIDALRADLLAYLDSVATVLPGDGWVLGQRVWYRAEAGRWSSAALAARACGRVEPWWCAALEGLAHHGGGAYEEAGRAFDRALALMPDDRARTWRIPRRAVDGDARDLLDDAVEAVEAVEATDGEEGADAGHAGGGPRTAAGGGRHGAGRAGGVDALLERLWTLADPLYLVPGNDRRTAHYARWTLSTLREESRNPFGLRWGRDLEELTVRHGWELWWERVMSRDPMAGVQVVGHKHPRGRDYLPTGDLLLRPWAADASDFVPRRRQPRSLYAPDYAPVLLPMDGQAVVFPRADRVALVATTWLPDDTTTHAGHTHPTPPWMEPGDQAGLPDRAGLFLAPVGGGPLRAAVAAGSEAALVVEAPAGRWIASAEAWSPPRRRAGRLRMGVSVDTVPPDVPRLSGLLFVRPGGGDPATLEAAAGRALPRARILPGQGVAVVWEVTGLGFDPAVLRYDLTVEKQDGNLFRRAGRWLGVVGDPERLTLAWEEPGPEAPARVLRQVDLDVPGLDEGRYEVRLEVALAGRSALVSTATLEVQGGG